MSNDVEKLKDIEVKIDSLTVDIGGQSEALESIDTKVTKIPSIDTELIDQGKTLDNIETEQEAQGKTLDDIGIEQTAQGLTLDNIDTEQTEQGITLDNIEIEQTDQGKTLDDIEIEILDQGGTLDNIEIEQTDQGKTLDDIETEQTNIGLSLNKIEENQTDGTQKVKLYDSDGYGVVIDRTTGAMTRISYTHNEIHKGNHFYIEDYTIIGVDGTYILTFVTPDSAKWSHIFFEWQSTGIVVVQLFEDSVVNVAGGIKKSFNNNRNSDNETGMIIRENDSFTGNGNLIYQARIGTSTNPAKSLQGSTAREKEIVLKHDTIYQLKATSLTATNVIDYAIDWYEHINIV